MSTELRRFVEIRSLIGGIEKLLVDRHINTMLILLQRQSLLCMDLLFLSLSRERTIAISIVFLPVAIFLRQKISATAQV